MSTAPSAIVVGLGAVGSACAAALAGIGCHVTAIGDPRRCTTQRSGGHLLLQSKFPGPLLELAARSLELFDDLGREAPHLGYRRTGSLLLAADDKEAARLHARVRALRQAGVPLQWLDGDTLRRIQPALAAGVDAGSFCPLDGQIEPLALASHWRHVLLNRGGQIVESPLSELDAHPAGGFRAVGPEVDVCGELVVLAGGPWTPALAANLGLSLDIQPRRGWLFRAVADRPIASCPLLGGDYLTAKSSTRAYEVAFNLQQFSSGEVVLGGTREFVGFSEAGGDEARREVLRVAARYVEGLDRLEWDSGAAGFRPWAPSPYLGRTEVAGCYLACGFEGDGVTLSAAAAERIAKQVVEDGLGTT